MGSLPAAHQISRPVRGRSPGKPIENGVSRERHPCRPVGLGLPAPPIKKPEENESLNSEFWAFPVLFPFPGKRGGSVGYTWGKFAAVYQVCLEAILKVVVSLDTFF